jgi:tRNA nucleotidyltransferase/poly(A) polymerase
MAWGGRDAARARLYDPFHGADDLRARVIRAVGDPDERFAEDALRMVRAVRLAATLGFAIEADTLAAIGRNAGLARHLSGPRVFAELRRILEVPHPSVALRAMADTGLLEVLLPELAAQRGVPQDKIPGHDLWEHTLATVDAVDAGRPVVRLAALLHDVAKPRVQAGGRFPGHDTEGAAMSDRILRDLAAPREESERVLELVRHHMFDYRSTWSDAAVRRFLRRVGVKAVDDLIALREADNVGSGRAAGHGDLRELRARIAAQLGSGHALHLADLAVDGDDLRVGLGLPPGPEIGRILERLLERVIADPSFNDRGRLLAAARRIHAAGRRTGHPGGR